MYIFGYLAITGFPFFTGFYSKDLLLELTYSRYIIDANFIYFLALSSAIFTAVYSIRLLFFVFFSQNNSFKAFFVSHESSKEMSISLMLLSISSFL